MFSRDLRQWLGPVNALLHGLHKANVPQEYLAAQVLPRRTPPYAISEKAPVGCSGLAPAFGEGRQQLLEMKSVRARRLLHHCRVAAPWPFVCPAHHPGPHAIQDNVAGQFKQVGVAVDQDRLVVPLLDMVHTMARVELLCVDVIELAHAACQIGIGRLDQRMVVAAPQAVGVAAPVALHANIAQKSEKPLRSASSS